MISRVNWWAGKVLDLVAPRVCEVCEGLVERPEPAWRRGPRRDVCVACEERLELQSDRYCQRCGESFDGDVDGRLRCMNCEDLTLPFAFAVARYRASGAVREMVHRFKFGRQLRLRQTLASMVVDVFSFDPRLEEMWQAGGLVMVPVPLSPRRLRERGFNQALQVSLLAGRELRVPVVDCLVRTRNTSPQSQLSRKKRLENMKGAIGVKPRKRGGWELEGMRVVLVDDVLTTGSTASACARVLIDELGVTQVVVATAARG
ncbi:ComF family protein [Sulfuriroseicoccus oceanibius]|uniref:ComF family protein n=1 Tax=Sulfuriroseicoccus oceanibius TaxID=2707525 RepID=A0A6B3LDT8_9BACT|nr:ComF family protein [Sulfuriroseicoccus oceanibius]QQL45751.1 ComF family protein [Sulfuriroseicoccus oceanibius]